MSIGKWANHVELALQIQVLQTKGINILRAGLDSILVTPPTSFLHFRQFEFVNCNLRIQLQVTKQICLCVKPDDCIVATAQVGFGGTQEYDRIQIGKIKMIHPSKYNSIKHA